MRASLTIGRAHPAGRQVRRVLLGSEGLRLRARRRDGKGPLEAARRGSSAHSSHGIPGAYHDRLYVPTSSYEEVGKAPDYACCNFRGSIVALDAKTGKEVWKSYAITELPKVMGKNRRGIDSIGPSGGAIWVAPTIDAKRNAIYAAVGNTYSGSESQPNTDAVVAFDLTTGKILWGKQLHPGDVYGCRNNEPNCRRASGPDFDFGASAVLATLPDGRDVIVAGQKSGVGVGDRSRQEGRHRVGVPRGPRRRARRHRVGHRDRRRERLLPRGRRAARRSRVGSTPSISRPVERVWFTPPPLPLKCGNPGRGCNGAQSAADHRHSRCRVLRIIRRRHPRLLDQRRLGRSGTSTPIASS